MKFPVWIVIELRSEYLISSMYFPPDVQKNKEIFYDNHISGQGIFSNRILALLDAFQLHLFLLEFKYGLNDQNIYLKM